DAIRAQQVIGIPASPAGGAAIEVAQDPAVVDDVIGDAREVARGDGFLVALGGEIVEERDGVVVRVHLVARCIALPPPLAVFGLVPLGGQAAAAAGRAL